jgi:hypothetical protein
MKPKSIEPRLHRITHSIGWSALILGPGQCIFLFGSMFLTGHFPGYALVQRANDAPIPLILSSVSLTISYLLGLVWLSLWIYRGARAFEVYVQARRKADGR